MRTALAAAVVFACALMGHAQAGSSPQEPSSSQQPQPEQTAPPPTAQPAQESPTPETQQPSNKPPAEEKVEPEAEPSAPSQPEVSQPETPKKPATSTSKPKAKHKTKKPVTPAEAPTKKVVRNGSTSEPEVQLAPRLSPKQQADQKQKISNLLSQTDTTLLKVSGRPLKASEEEMVKQIRVYMDQAKQATEAGDLQRAQNLASKAHLLSDELVKK